MRKGSSLRYYARRRKQLVGWKFGHEFSDEDQYNILLRLLAKGKHVTLEWVREQRWFCCFSGRVDRRILDPVDEKVI